MGSARSMTGGGLSLVKYMQDKQDKSDIHPRAQHITNSYIFEDNPTIIF